MNAENKNTTTKYIWPCRILLTIAFLRSISGYIVFVQTQYQLVSPIIPKETIYLISYPFIIASLISSCFFIAALWFYFFKKNIITIALSIIAILAFELATVYFVK